jgi:hypothetical protein
MKVWMAEGRSGELIWFPHHMPYRTYPEPFDIPKALLDDLSEARKAVDAAGAAIYQHAVATNQERGPFLAPVVA